MFDILTIGAATRDVFLESPAFQVISSGEFQTGLGECVALGSKNEVSNLTFETGGGATNAATTFARLGFKTQIAASVGNDNNGEEIIKVLAKEKIDTSAIQKQNETMTGYSTLLLWSGGQRSILVFRGASDQLEIAKITNANWKTKWVYLTSLGQGAGQIKLLADKIKQNNISLCWNPGEVELSLGLAAEAPLLNLTKILLLNKEEAATLLGLPLTEQNKILAGAKSLAPIVLITDGDQGAYLYEKREWRRIATTGVKPKNPTGAGDAFGSGFVAGVIKYSDAKKAAQLAILNSESVIQHTGAKKGILKKWPTPSELKKVKISQI